MRILRAMLSADRRGRTAAATIITAAFVLILAALARAPYQPRGGDDALLRFSWRLPAPAHEDCRRRTADELEALPSHMRTPEVCERVVARYAMVTQIADAPADTVALKGGGVKGDRPLFVLFDRPMDPGRHRVRVALTRSSPGAPPEPIAALDTVLVMQRGHVQLVTLEPETRRLVVRSR